MNNSWKSERIWTRGSVFILNLVVADIEIITKINVVYLIIYCVYEGELKRNFVH